jgi:hypothetical protein
MTVEPTEILIGSGENPRLSIVALTAVGAGAMGELGELLPQAIAVVNSIATKIAFIRKDILLLPLW